MKPLDILGMGPKREVTPLADGYLITVTPPEWSGFTTSHCVKLNVEQFSRYMRWMNTSCLIQDALPELHPAEREILITGLGPEEFPEEEE
jgi:hypothetical protein